MAADHSKMEASSPLLAFSKNSKTAMEESLMEF
jgi:hypothetical protein